MPTTGVEKAVVVVGSAEELGRSGRECNGRERACEWWHAWHGDELVVLKLAFEMDERIALQRRPLARPQHLAWLCTSKAASAHPPSPLYIFTSS